MLIFLNTNFLLAIMRFNNASILEFYDYHIRKYGKEDIRAMGWHDEEEYSIRFDIVTKVGELGNASILDVGCGFGGLYKYLISSEIGQFSYLGVDIVPKMVEIARDQNPTGTFKVVDILKEEVGKFDYVFCIGALNITTDNFDKYFREMLRKMIQLSNKAIVISFLSEKKYLATGPYHFENPKSLKKMIEKEFDVSVKIVEDERLKGEGCLFIYKD